MIHPKPIPAWRRPALWLCLLGLAVGLAPACTGPATPQNETTAQPESGHEAQETPMAYS